MSLVAFAEVTTGCTLQRSPARPCCSGEIGNDEPGTGLQRAPLFPLYSPVEAGAAAPRPVPGAPTDHAAGKLCRRRCCWVWGITRQLGELHRAGGDGRGLFEVFKCCLLCSL